MVKLFVEPIRFVPKPHTNEHVLVAAADLLRPKKVRLPAPASCQNSSKARSKNFRVRIYRNCGRWVSISGIPIHDKPLNDVEKVIDELISDMQKHLYLR